MQFGSNDIDLTYYTEWGGAAWEHFTEIALRHLLGNQQNFTNKKVLEIGPRTGKMSCLFAQHGAEVTAIDISAHHLEDAALEAQKHGVEQDIEFIRYDGDLDTLGERQFDLIFSKSVFFAIPDRALFLQKLSEKLSPGGKTAHIENGYGNWLIHTLRKFRHRHWDYNSCHFFTDESIKVFSESFHIEKMEKKHLPPIYCVCTSKLPSS